MKEKLIEALKNGFIGGTLSSIVSGLLNYFILPFPRSILDNVIGHSVGGFICGFISAFIGVMMILHYIHQDQTLTDLKGGADYEVIR